MIDPKKILASLSISASNRALVKEFASPSSQAKRFLFGRNEHAATLAKAFDVTAFVDDFAADGQVFMGKPVVCGYEIPENAIVVNCVLNAKPRTAARRIENLGFANHIDYIDFCHVFPERIPWPFFVTETRRELHRHLAEWQALYVSLEDDISRQIFHDVISFRLTGDYNMMAAYDYRPQDQYFEDFVPLRKGEVFVDAGGYDGDTSELFVQNCPEYERVLFFEPSLPNLQRARDRLSGVRDIEYYQLGLSDRVEEVAFDADRGSASAVNATGSERIRMTTLDDCVCHTVSFIKMDLEGWELKALKGAKRHVIQEMPTMAVAAYHHAPDFRLLFSFVQGLSKEYSIRLRHYTESWTESVLYFLSKDRKL